MPRKSRGRPHPPGIAFRQRAFQEITQEIGVYAVCDLDGVPIYVGQSVAGIRERVRRHLTSARSDVIANRQVDIWEAAWVLCWPAEIADIPLLEAAVFHHFNDQSPLMNGTVPPRSANPPNIPEPMQRVQIMSDEDLEARRQPSLRLPRQIEHYGRLVDHFLTVKDSDQLSRALDAHFERLMRYHREFLELIGPPPVGSDDADT